MKEEWKQVEVDTRYEVSTHGRVRRGERILKGVNLNGYRAVYIGGKKRKVHRLVAMAFLELTPTSPRNIVVMHLDDDKTNNSLSNLSVGRQYENMSYRTVDTVGVTQRSDGRWKAYVYIEGKVCQKVFKSKELAISWREDMMLHT